MKKAGKIGLVFSVVVCSVVLPTQVFAQSKKKIKVNVSVMERRNAATFQRYEGLRDGDVINYMPSKVFDRVRIFKVELDPGSTLKKYPEALITSLKITFYAGNQVEIGTWENKLKRPHHKDEIWAGYDEELKVMNEATYAQLTTMVSVGDKEFEVNVFVVLKR